MAKNEVLYVWQIEYVLVKRDYDTAPFSTDTLVAPSFSRAVERAEVEARRFMSSAKVKGIKCITKLTA